METKRRALDEIATRQGAAHEKPKDEAERRAQVTVVSLLELGPVALSAANFRSGEPSVLNRLSPARPVLAMTAAAESQISPFSGFDRLGRATAWCRAIQIASAKVPFIAGKC